MRRTKYRTEKTKRLKTKALEKRLFWSQIFWLQTFPRRTIFLGGVRRYPLEDFFSTTVSDVTVADRPSFQTSPPEVLLPGEINPKISIFYRSKKRKKRQHLKFFHFYQNFTAFLGKFL